MDDNLKARMYTSLVASLLDEVDQQYRTGFESIIENALEREKAFAVTLLALEEEVTGAGPTVDMNTSNIRNQFNQLSNLAVLSQLIDICGLSLYKEQIISEKIRLIFGSQK